VSSFILVRVKAKLANDHIATCNLRFLWSPAVGPSAAQMQNIANVAQTELATHAAKFSTDLELGLCSAQTYERVVPVPPDPPFFSPTSLEFVAGGAVTAGSDVTPSSVPQAALAIKLATIVPKRRALGRAFLFPPPEDRVDADGSVNTPSDYVAVVQEIAEAVEGSTLPNDIDHIVHSVTYGDVNEVVAYSTDAFIDTQRRRLKRP